MMQINGWNFARKLFLSLVLAITPWVASVAADTTPAKSDPAWLTDVRTSIKSNNYEQALKQLQSANEVNSADWNNLMGYSLRKKQPPDLVASEKYYQAALKIDPSHRAALEYYGELMLMKKDLSGAEAMLARLDKACLFGCEEYSDLKASIAKYQGKK
ncbi:MULTISPECIES: tetratricopeptide repeat protein [unclassified Polynucleobacter]|jgi:Flp pilus assembly protein TadD|uniref:tetratricopeptide repeat protein n=1 Tax=unclassified Polynucleobacter TaxID=2640945 RepID=UPI0025CFD17E|nr:MULTISPECIES: tetratricopeptide repeat protein [unclassified Polynucleobacter]